MGSCGLGHRWTDFLTDALRVGNAVPFASRRLHPGETLKVDLWRRRHQER
jgi:hypothetical protein